MTGWTIRNWTVLFAVDAAETKRILAGLLSALVLLAAGPASAFEATAEADGSTTYFFGTPSLRIESAGALDLSGLRRIEAFADGVRANGFFLLAATADAAQALMAPDAVWTGHADGARSLDIFAPGTVDLGMADIVGFEWITITAGNLVFDGNIFSADGTPIQPRPDLVVTPGWHLPPRPVLTVPEPQAWLLLAAGLALMQIFRRRGGAHASGHA